MAERDPISGWTREWQAMQEQFLAAWRDAMRDSTTAKGIPLHECLDLWTRLASGQAGQDELTERMLGSARQVVDLMQRAMEAAGAAGRAAGGGDAEGWRRSLAQTFGALDLSRNPVLDAMRSATGTGAESFEQFAIQARAAMGALAGPVQGWLSTPTFGLAREAQERQQKLVRALAEQAEAERAYQALLLKASQLALAKFEGKLAERDAPGRQVRSGRELYDLWIDAAEEGYAEVAMSPEFRGAYADMVNGQMRVRQAVQREVELISGQFGMPTRSEIDATHRRIADLSRRLAALAERGAGDGASMATPAPARAPATRPRTPPRPKPKAAPAATKRAAKSRAAKPVQATQASFADRLAESRANAKQPTRRGKGAKE